MTEGLFLLISLLAYFDRIAGFKKEGANICA
jgi:hypothetical protein